MAEVKTDQEPSIEEILESIRQIISEDGEQPQQAAAAPQPVKAPDPFDDLPPLKPAPVPHAEQPASFEILDLTEKVEPVRTLKAEAPAMDDFVVSLPETKQPEARSFSSPAITDDALMSDMATGAAASAMAKLLAGNVAVEREVAGRVGNVTLEDMAKELMRPLIKTWLDQNLPGIIEKMVAKEIEKVSRMAMRQ